MESEARRRMQRFEQVCKQAGVKITHQRLEIYREIAHSGDHPDAESVYRRVKERVPTISLDTVYRALWLFSDLGLITTLGASREGTRFDANMDHHHHFVCTECGVTRDFYDQRFNDLTLPETVNEIGRPASTHVEVRGICRDCAVNKQ